MWVICVFSDCGLFGFGLLVVVGVWCIMRGCVGYVVGLLV